MERTEKFCMCKYFVNTGTNIYAAHIRGVNKKFISYNGSLTQSMLIVKTQKSH